MCKVAFPRNLVHFPLIKPNFSLICIMILSTVFLVTSWLTTQTQRQSGSFFPCSIPHSTLFALCLVRWFKTLVSRGSEWILVYMLQVGNYSPCASQKWCTPSCSLCSDIKCQSLSACCQRPGRLLLVPATQGRGMFPSGAGTAFTPVFHHHLTAYLFCNIWHSFHSPFRSHLTY